MPDGLVVGHRSLEDEIGVPARCEATGEARPSKARAANPILLKIVGKVAEWCNGSTIGSGPIDWGSIPYSATLPVISPCSATEE